MPRLKLWSLPAILAFFLLTNLTFASTLAIKNHSGYADQEVYLLVWGYSPTDTSGAPHYLNLLTGDFPACSVADNTVAVPGQADLYCDYWVTLDRLKQADGTYSFSFPKIISARLYISFSQPVYLHINPGAPPGMREPSVTNPSDPNYRTIFDKFEWTYDAAGLHANTTCVDFFCLPLQFEMKDGATSVGALGFSSSRAAVVQALEASPWLKSLKTPYRFYAPATDNPGVSFPAAYFDSYIDYCWTYYRTHTLTITGIAGGAGFTAAGTVQNLGGVDTLVLTVQGTAETHTIQKPTSSQVFACNGDGVFNPAGSPGMDFDRDGFLKVEVASALNRTVMHLAPTPPDFSEWSAVGNYYQQNGLPADVFKTNIYSQILHQLAIDHLVYGYPYDDKYNQASYLSSETATDLLVTINDCKSSTGASSVASILGLLLVK